MSSFEDMFNGGQSSASGDISQGYTNAINTYSDYLDKINEMFQPYMEQGQRAGNQMEGMGNEQNSQYMQMMGAGPGGTGNWQTEYTESPWAAYQTDVGNQAANASAAASGMLGSGNNQRATATMSEGIASKDRQQYYEDMMGMGKAAQSNYEPLMQTGAGMASQLGGYTYGTGGEIGKAQIGQGTANAYGDIAQQQAINGMIGGATGAISGGMSGGGW